MTLSAVLAMVGLCGAMATVACESSRSVALPALAWAPCSDAAGFECATVDAPLDYDQPRGETIKLALIRHRARDPGARLGSLFVGMGGPGDAGTHLLPVFLGHVPAELVKRFDIVSWDPRGAGDSTAVRCFDTEQQEGAFFTDLPGGFPVGPAEEATWIRVWDGFAATCGKRVGTLLAHISTADSARDLDLMRRAVGDSKLNYLGLSYGTVLGATYANLYPGKIRALVLDGNVDPVKWFEKPSGEIPLSTFIRMESDIGTSATLARFLDLCGAATVSRCAFSAGDPAATHAKFDTLLTRLRAKPVTISGPNGPIPYTYTGTVGGIVGILYTTQPAGLRGFPGWAAGAKLLQDLWMASEPSAVAASVSGPTAPPATPGKDKTYTSDKHLYAVLCLESPNPRPADLYSKIAEFAVHRSGPVSAYWAWLSEPCTNWPAQTVDVYTGPWNHQTSALILVIGNTFDPSTPYQGSVAMAHRLANARLLTVDGYGHTALLNRSTCANQHEVDYLLDPTRLPPPDTHCPQDVTPFTD
jgi:pimeloyl-ACP methyl ester carboxylesterase